MKYGLNIKRISRDLVELSFQAGGERSWGRLSLRVLGAVLNALRSGTVTETALLAFLTGATEETNLAQEAQPIILATFLVEEYLPKKKHPEVSARALQRESDSAKRLSKTIGGVPLHEIRPQHAEKHKATLLGQKFSNSAIRMDLITLSQAVNFGVSCGLLKKNPLPPVRGLPSTDRTEIWLRLPDIVKLMRALPAKIKPLAYFLIFTGARLSEALEVRASDIDWRKRIIWIPNIKRRRRSRVKAKPKRPIKIDDLGPRFIWLITEIIKPDPESGYLFPGKIKGRHLHISTADDHFQEGVMRAGLEHLIPDHVRDSGGHDHLIPHDCRGTFFNHGSIVGWPEQKLRAYSGQKHMESIQSYLGEAESHEPSESIFGHPPARVRRAQRKEQAADAPEQPVQAPIQPSSELPASKFLH